MVKSEFQEAPTSLFLLTRESKVPKQIKGVVERVARNCIVTFGLLN
ncbi:MAG: hypothetical protein ACLP5H_19080 [Desulfomonilaceae bacterium]